MDHPLKSRFTTQFLSLPLPAFIRPLFSEACFQAFLNNNYVGALVLLGVMVHYL